MKLTRSFPSFVAFCSDLNLVTDFRYDTIIYNVNTTSENPLIVTRPNGTVATYTCMNGYKLDGNATRTCDTGNWTGTVPECIASEP